MGLRQLAAAVWAAALFGSLPDVSLLATPPDMVVKGGLVVAGAPAR